jgi:3',5'-cyclic AMP phosphodiesterase CpdA
MRRIAHLSDLHFGATDPVVVEALAADLASDPPDLVVVSGDLTMRARSREFRAARRFLERLPAPVLAVPGNHDVTPFKLVERFLDPFGAWRREFGRDTEWHWQDAELGIVGLNTARRWGSFFDWSQGRVGREALARLSARMAALPPGLFRIVVAHHPFLPPLQAPRRHRLVGGAERALEAFLAHGVRMVLSGHLHLGYVRDDHRAKVAAPAVGDSVTAARRLLVVQAATATSTRLRGEPNAYNRITVEGGVARVEPRVWTGEGWAGGGGGQPPAARPPSRSASGSASADSPAIAQNPAPPSPA